MEQTKPTPLYEYGHRGVMGEAPQNTLASFEKVLQAGLPAIELDVELSSDGRAVIFHDDTVDEITGQQAHGPINSFSFDELRRLNVSDGFDAGTSYQIPTLEEVLDLVDRYRHSRDTPALVNIELKGVNTAEPTAKIVKEYLASGWLPENFIVSSFKHDELAKFKQLMPQLDIAILIDDKQWKALDKSNQKAVELADSMGAVGLNPGLEFVNSELVQMAHQAGLKVNVYTIKTAEEYAKMAQMGVDGVFVNFLNLAQN